MEKQVALNPDRSIKGGIYARYNLSRDGDQASTIETQVVNVPRKSRKLMPKSVSIPNPSQNSPPLTPSETSSSKCLMPLKYKKPSSVD